MITPLTDFFENNKTLLSLDLQKKLLEQEKEHIILAYEAGKCKGSLDDEDYWGEEYFKDEYFKEEKVCISDLIFHNIP